jgi:uncharacterized protein YjiS (DUF1127 family)
MGPISAFVTADYTAATTTQVKQASVVRMVYAALSTTIIKARKSAAERQLRADLAEMNDSLLKDIGVAEDEIYLIRAGHVFTPRAWVHASRTRR